ncbi:MAG: transposase [Holdemanella porci]
MSPFLDVVPIATIHTSFGRDLKWNPHIHCLIPELIYSFKRIKPKHFIISISLSLEKHFNLN